MKSNYKLYKQISNNKFDIGKMSLINPGYQASMQTSTEGWNTTPGTDMSGDIQTEKLQSILQPISKGASTVSNLAGIYSNYKNGSMSNAGKAMAVAGAAVGTYNMANDLYNAYTDRITGNLLVDMSGNSVQSKNGVLYKTYDGFDRDQVYKYVKNQNNKDTANSAIDGLNAGASLGSIWGPWGTAVGALAGGFTGWVGGIIGSDSRSRQAVKAVRNTEQAMQGYNDQSEGVAGSIGMRNKNLATYADGGKNPGLKFTYGKNSIVATPQGYTYGMASGLASPDEGLINMATGETKYLGSKYYNVKDKRLDIIPVSDAMGKNDDGTFLNFVGIPGHHFINGKNGLTWADITRPAFKLNEQIKDLIDKVESGNGDQNTKQINMRNLNRRMQSNADFIKNIVRMQGIQDGYRYSCGKGAKFDPGKDLDIPSAKLDPILDTVDGYDIIGNSLPDVKYKPIYNDTANKIRDGIRNSGKPITPPTPLNSRYSGEIYTNLANRLALGANLLASKKNYNPTTRNSFVPNRYAPQALSILSLMRYDPSNEINDLNNQSRQSVYSALNTGGLTSGQRMASILNNYLNRAQIARNIYTNANNTNNQYRATYANQLMSYGQDEAARRQQANAAENDMRAKAYGSRFAANQAWFNSVNNYLGANAKDTTAYYDKARAVDFQNRLLDLYGKQQMV